MKLVKIKGKISAYKEFQLDIFGDRFIDTFRGLRLRKYIWGKRVNKRLKFKYIKFIPKFERVMQLLYDYYVERKNPPRRKRRFRYRIHIIEKPKIRTFRNMSSLSFKRIRLYYKYLSLSHFKKFDKEARKKSGYILSHLIMFLEFRMCVFLYKMSLIRNMYEASAFLKQKIIIIEDRIPLNINSRIGIFEIMKFKNLNTRRKVKFRYIESLIKGFMYFPIPRYMYANGTFMLFLIFKRPEIAEVPHGATQLDHVRRYIPTRDPARTLNLGGSERAGYRMSHKPNIGIDIKRFMERQGRDQRNFKKAINKVAR